MASSSAQKQRSALEERLLTLIRANGPISVADYMADALLHPHDGYYTSKAPIGARGDFTTAPEISQIFGELIGLWLVQSWIDIGSPKSFNLIELGPGRGVLMADILRAAALRPEFLNAANICLVETSGRLRHEQQKRLNARRTEATPPVDWADDLESAPEGPCLIVANEFFDCLPVRQFVRMETNWRERMVGAVEENGDDGLIFTTDKTPPLAQLPLPDKTTAKLGDIFEYGEAHEAAAAAIADRLQSNDGRALIIDYGHVHSGFGDTLQAVRDHAPWPVLDAPGDADITAHVNFERISRAAFDRGAAVFGPVAQGTFLDRLGLAMRVERLCAGKSDAEAEDIHAGAFRIAAASEMGEIFKVLCLSTPGLAPPAGFDA
ncbi:MAG: SAM-dependent methyltransferase [Pseudomonadota bacterium]